MLLQNRTIDKHGFLVYGIGFWGLMLLCFINSMAQMVTVFVSLFLHSNGIEIYLIGILISVFGIGVVFGGVVGGYLSDHFTPKHIALFALIMNTIVMLLFPFCHEFIALIGVDLFVLGFCNSVFRPASLLMILTFDKINKPSVIMSYRRVSVNLGIAVGGVLSGVLFEDDMYTIFYYYALCLFTSFIILCYINIETDMPLNNKTHKSTTYQYSGYKLYVSMLLFLFGLLAYNQQQTVYSIYLRDHLFINTKLISMLFAINGVMVVLLQIPITHLVRNISPYKLSAIGSLLIGVGFGLVILNYGILIGIASVLIWTIGELLLFTSTFDLLMVLGSNKKGKDMGIYQSTFSIATLIGPMLGTFMYEININYVWYICLLLGLIAFIGFLCLEKFTAFCIDS